MCVRTMCLEFHKNISVSIKFRFIIFNVYTTTVCINRAAILDKLDEAVVDVCVRVAVVFVALNRRVAATTS